MVILSLALLICLTTPTYHVTNGCPVPPSLVNTSCSTHCCCTVDQNNKTAARCNIRGMSPLSMEQIQLPQDLFSLDLSSSGLGKVPRFLRKLSNISALSLANNSMNNSKLSLQTLKNLENLKTLNVSHTDLWTLQINQSNQISLTSLENVFVSQSHLADFGHWDNLLTLPNIRRVMGVKWARSCDQCNISKMDDHNAVQKLLDYNRTFRGGDRYSMVQDKEQRSSKLERMFYAVSSNGDDAFGNICLFRISLEDLEWEAYYLSPKRYLSPGYMLQCYCNPNNCVTKQGLEHLPSLFRLLCNLFNSLFFIGTVALILNITTILVILTSKTLRKSPSMILVFNMAVCDFLLIVFCMLIPFYNPFAKSDETSQLDLAYYKYRPLRKLPVNVCRFQIFIFTVAQNVSVIISLFLTVEKYLVIVYPMSPGRRMTKKLALIFLCLTWFASIAYSIDAVFNLSDNEEDFNNSEFNNFYCSASGHHVNEVPVVLRNGQQINTSFPLSVFWGVLHAFIFLCTIPFYIHIFIVVKKSSTQMGIQREGVLARKLALLVFTNFLFNVVPFSVAPGLGSRSVLRLDFFNPLTRTYSSFQAYLICFVWLPVMLLCLNSCLNPLMYAFRHHQFQTRFRQTVTKVIETFRK